MTNKHSREESLRALHDVWDRRDEDDVEVALNGWPTIIAVADASDLVRSTIHQAFRELEETGTIVVAESQLLSRTGTLNTAAPATEIKTDEREIWRETP